MSTLSPRLHGNGVCVMIRRQLPAAFAASIRPCEISWRLELATTTQLIRVGHSPDPDDAFMFHALANEKIDTGPYHFVHELVDIETLNRRAFSGELELTAVSIHAYAHLADQYALCACGASMGEQYGPMVVTRDSMTLDQLKDKTIAIPGTLTSAYLALRLCLNVDFAHVVVPFDEIIRAVAEGHWDSKPVDAGLIIHEGQLTYARDALQLVVDLGQWWYERHQLPLPLGANAIRRDLGPETMKEVTAYLRKSIEYGLTHRSEALEHAMQYGRDLDRSDADKFVGMYVNDRTLDFGPEGRQSVTLFLKEGFDAGIVPRDVAPQFIN